MSAGSEFQTEGAATLKPQEANVVWTQGTDNRLVLEEQHYKMLHYIDVKFPLRAN